MFTKTDKMLIIFIAIAALLCGIYHIPACQHYVAIINTLITAVVFLAALGAIARWFVLWLWNIKD